MFIGLSVSSESPHKLITPIQTPITSQNVSPRINGINESLVLDNCSKINQALKCGTIDDLLIVEKAEDNVSHIRLTDRMDDSSVLENNFENASITERNVLDSPRNGESHNVETSNSIEHVCTQSVLAKENFVDTDVISSNNSSLADSVKTISEQEGSSNDPETNDEIEPASLDLEDPASTPDILHQLDDDFYNYEEFKNSTEWNDTVCDQETNETILQTDYLNVNKPNSDRECNEVNEVEKTYTPYGDDDVSINDTNNDRSAFVHDERTVCNLVTSQQLNVDGTDVFTQPDCEFSIEPKYIEMYDVISNNETSMKSSETLHDSFNFDFTFDDAVREESNLDCTSVHTHTENNHTQKSSTKNDANTFFNQFCDVKNTIQSKENEQVAIETKNQIVQEKSTSEEIPAYTLREPIEEDIHERIILENGLIPHDSDNSDFTEFMEHRDFDNVSKLIDNFHSLSDNDKKYETVQIHDASSSDMSCVQKLSPIEKASLPSSNTSFDCSKDKINLITSTTEEACATCKIENSVVYFSDGEFYDINLSKIEPVLTKVQENSCLGIESAQNEDDDFGDFTNFSNTTVQWKHDDAERPEATMDDDDFGDFNDFETSVGVVETQQFSLKESICRIENKNVS